MKALRVERKLAKFAAARVASAFGAGRGAGLGPLRLTETGTPEHLGDGWVGVTPILSGICGSDLATVDGRTSRYFEDIVSFPFVPGHEIVGVVISDAVDAHGHALSAGQRVIIQPVLGCVARALPLCEGCASGNIGRCQNISHGHVRPGLQTGFCVDTGGGWSDGPIQVHTSQLFCVPDDLSDDDAVMVEPMACALHATLRASYGPEDTVAIIGAGTLGLGVIASIDHAAHLGVAARPARVIVAARYQNQRALASSLGADEVVPPEHLSRAVRLATRSGVVGPPSGRAHQLGGGAQVVIDCVGSESSLEESLRIVAPGGRIILVGMPARTTIDLASLWQREIELVGAYAYGVEDVGGELIPTFDLAIDLVRRHSLGRLVSARYPLDRFEEALAHAGAAGRRGSIKIVFEVGSRRATTKRED